MYGYEPVAVERRGRKRFLAAAHATGGEVPGSERALWDALTAYVRGDDRRVLLVTAAPGSGKTAGLARWIDGRRERGQRLSADSAIFAGTPGSPWTHEGLLASLYRSLRRRPDRVLPPLPLGKRALRRRWRELLRGLRRPPAVLVLDGLEHVQGADAGLDWLPRPLPPGLKVIIALDVDPASATEGLRRRLMSEPGVCEVQLPPGAAAASAGDPAAFLASAEDHVTGRCGPAGSDAVSLLFGALAHSMGEQAGGLPPAALVGAVCRELDDPTLAPALLELLHPDSPHIAVRGDRIALRRAALYRAALARYPRPDALRWHELLARWCAGWLTAEPAAEAYALEHETSHLLRAGRHDLAREKLTNLPHLAARLDALGPEQITAVSRAFEETRRAALAGPPIGGELSAWSERWRVNAHLLERADSSSSARDILLQAASGSPGAVDVVARHLLSRDATPGQVFLLRRTAAGARRPHLTLHGHHGRVAAVALHRNGALAVSGSGDGTVRVWDLRSGESLHTLHLGEPVTSLQLVGDLVTARSEHLAASWDIGSGVRLSTFRAQPPPAAPRLAGDMLASGPWGRRLLLTASDRMIEAHDTQDGTVESLCWHGGRALCAALGRVGSRTIMGAADGALRVWEIGADRAPKTPCHQGRITAIATAPATDEAPRGAVLSVADDATLRRWSLETGACVATAPLSFQPIGLALDGPGGRAAVMGRDRSVHLIGADGSPIRAFGPMRAPPAFALFDDARDRILCLGHSAREQPTELRLFALGGAANPEAVRLDTDGIQGACLLPGGQVVTMPSAGRWRTPAVQTWDPASGEQIATIDYNVRSCAAHADGRLALGGAHGGVVIWDALSNEGSARFHGGRRPVTALAFLSETRILSADSDGVLRIWEIGQSAEIATLTPMRGDAVFSMTTDPAGRHAYTVHASQVLRVWDLNEGCIVGSLPLEGQPHALTFAGGRVICALDHGLLILEVLRSRSGAVLARRDYRTHVTAATWHPNQRLIAAASADGKVELLEWHPGPSCLEPVWEALIPGGVSDLAWSGDGRALRAQCSDGPRVIWGAPPIGTPGWHDATPTRDRWALRVQKRALEVRLLA